MPWRGLRSTCCNRCYRRQQAGPTCGAWERILACNRQFHSVLPLRSLSYSILASLLRQTLATSLAFPNLTPLASDASLGSLFFFPASLTFLPSILIPCPSAPFLSHSFQFFLPSLPLLPPSLPSLSTPYPFQVWLA